MAVLSVVTLLTLALGATAQASWKSHIKNVVVLVEENRSFDTLVGGLTYNRNIDGVLGKPYCNPVNVTDPNSRQKVCAQPKAQNVAEDDPNHSISGVNMQVFGTWHPDEAKVAAGEEKPTMNGFITEQMLTYHTDDVNRAAEAINYFTPNHIPAFNALAENFVLFDRWFCAVPGPTNPNRAYLTSGTSHGHGRNDAAFDVSGLPQRSIFQQLSERNITWINYSNTTGFLPDAMFYEWTAKSGKALTNVKPINQFYEDAKAGKLPRFTYINPECCSYTSYHPPSPISMGEGFIKSVYEALRNGPQWNETLFILTFDEHGGFADHVPTPVNVPAGDDLTYTENAPDGKPMTFDFKRLGPRVPTLLISPWVGKGVVQNAPAGQAGEFTHTSIPAFLAKLWDLDLLTPRVAWSATFENLITGTLRTDTPKTLPEPVAW
ncbi:hypothetical protein VTN00DRAFT_7987 [Thermoascus crustaceus]|uniref:uncharacterized protein n=1 Tax=Thermoascus crustaceus TaxID=5088 RepID=UPI003743D4DA